MIENKKGLSAIVTTLIIIGIGLVAVGILWYVFSTVTDEQSGEVANASGNIYQTCIGAGYNSMTAAQTCPGAIKYIGGEKCCTEVPTA